LFVGSSVQISAAAHPSFSQITASNFSKASRPKADSASTRTSVNASRRGPLSLRDGGRCQAQIAPCSSSGETLRRRGCAARCGGGLPFRNRANRLRRLNEFPAIVHGGFGDVGRLWLSDQFAAAPT
jgi:hypothetical protein